MLTIKFKPHYVFFIVMCLFFLGLLTTDTLGTKGPYTLTTLATLFTIIFVSLLSKKQRKRLRSAVTNWTGILLLSFSMYMSIMVFAYIDTGALSIKESLINTLYMAGGLIIALITLLTIDNDNDTTRRILTFFLFLAAILVLYKVYSLRQYILSSSNKDFLVTNWALVSASIFPFVFYIKKTKHRALFFSLVVLSALIGNKRSVIITIIASLLFVFTYLSILKYKSLQPKHLLYLIGVSVIAFFCFQFYGDIYQNIIYRLENISSDGGSGRLDIWGDTLHFIRTSHLENKLFGGGAGFFSLEVKSGISSAHNDLLELIISYGFFGLLFYTLFTLRLAYLAIYHLRKKDELSFFAVSLFFTFIIMSNFSGVFIYYTYYQFIFIGLALLEINKFNYKT